MNGIPIGCVLCFATQKYPDGFLPCDGRELSKSLYRELYTMIGDTWGETTSTFFLPDLRGQFVRGWDDGNGVDPESGADCIRKFGSEQADSFQGHAHNLSVNGMMSESELHLKSKYIEYGTNTIQNNKTTSFNVVLTPSEQKTELERIERAKQGFLGSFIGLFAKFGSNKIMHRHELPEIKVKDASNSTFQKVRVSTETRPQNVALMYCIKVK